MTGTGKAVFVSHAAIDRDEVSQLVAGLRSAFPGLEFFFSSDPDSLKPGDVWWDELREMLQRSAVLIACVSRWSATRPWILFEAGIAAGRGSMLIPVLVDDLPVSDLGPPLSMFHAVRLDEHGVADLIGRIAGRLGLAPREFSYPAARVHADLPSPEESPGVYAERPLDLQSGWVRYSGNGDAFFAGKNYVAIGQSSNDGFRYPPVDSLVAPWRFFGFRFRFTDQVYVYAVVRLLDGTTRKVIANTASASWGFTGDPRDEYRVPLGRLRKEVWQVAILDLQSIDEDFPSPIQCVTGFRVRGPLWLSHLWCVASPDQIPARYRKNALKVRYPR